MKVDPIVRRETLRLIMGLLAADVLAAGVFLLLEKVGWATFDYTVILGLLLGTVIAAVNFFLLGLTIQKEMGKENPKKSVQLSYTLRMLLMAAAVVAAALLPCFHVIATIVPLILTTPVVLIMRAITEKKEV